MGNMEVVVDRVYGYQRPVADIIAVFERRPKAPGARGECYWTGDLPDCPAYWRIRAGVPREGDEL